MTYGEGSTTVIEPITSSLRSAPRAWVSASSADPRSGTSRDWLGPSAIGWFAGAIYGAGMLAAAADGFFGRTRITT